jgi:predicted metal-dependent phosphoesterase TrpH
MKYKINIHAHTIFSDGVSSPYVMALRAKELGFTALVVTDHFYGSTCPEFMSVNSMRLLRKACREAATILPVIIGMEVVFMGQEVLVFGGAAIKSILENGKPTYEEMKRLKKETGCALILCHPGELDPDWLGIVDGFEYWNSGQNCFINRKGETRPLGKLEGKPGWCDSDAHSVDMLDWNYNLVDTKIETETDLIKYIKRGKQPEFYINDRLS